MDWQIQKLDGTWIEAESLPKDSTDYQCAILMHGKTEHLRLVPTLNSDNNNNTWFVVNC
jgi:hypothetical protein